MASLDTISCERPSPAKECANAQTAIPPALSESFANAVSAKRSAVDVLEDEEDANPTDRSEDAMVCPG